MDFLRTTVHAIRLWSILLLNGIHSCIWAQPSSQTLSQLIHDSAHVSVYTYVKKAADVQPNNKQLLEARLRYKVTLNEWDDMCRYIAEAKLNNVKVSLFLQHYARIHCTGNVKQMPKHIQYMYEQKGQTEENGYVSQFSKSDSLRGMLNSSRSSYDIMYYDLHLRFDTKKHTIAGYNSLYFAIDTMVENIQIDAQKHLMIDSVVYNNRQISFHRAENALNVPLPTDLRVGDTTHLTVFYHAKPPTAKNPPWEGGFVWKKSPTSKVWAGVACEHLGASFWWPCKDHPSDEPDSMRMSFDVANPFRVISNGRLVKEQPLPNQYTRFTWKVTNPINAYNATFYIGLFSALKAPFRDINGTMQHLTFYYLPPNEEKAKKYFPLSLEVLKSYESLFGEYAFWSDGYALVESPYEGMEHQSAVAIGYGYGTAKYNGKIYKKVKDDFLIIHESAHEWWGNSVTANDMADAWLQEGFATFAELLYIEQKYGPEVYLQELDYKRAFILNLWPLLGTRNVNDNAFIGSDVYYKGALLLQNIRLQVNNDSVFFHLMKSFAVKYRYKTVGTEAFVTHVKEVSGKDLGPIFKVYLEQIQLPTLVYTYFKHEEGLLLKCRWRNVPKDFHMSFALKLSNGQYQLCESGTENSKIVLKGAKYFNFINNQTNLKDCPASFYGYFNTMLE